MTLDHEAYLALGANLGERRKTLQSACELLARAGDIHIVAKSSLHETAPQGGPAGQGDYLNAVLHIRTGLPPAVLLERCLAVEAQLGRQRSVLNAPRTIDIDILLYDDLEIHSPTLDIPHPRMHQRRFVLSPLAEVAPESWHPVLRKSALDLLADLPASDSDRVARLANAGW